MILSSFLLAVVSVLAVSSVSQPASMRPKIVALGDSLTSGRGVNEELAWPALVQKRLDADKFDYTIVNAGVSGDTSSGALRRYERALDGDVRVLIIALGANDGLRGVPVDRVQQNLGRIIETAQARDAAVLLCAMEALPIHGWDYSVAFHKAYLELATRYKVPLVPFFLLNVIGNPELMQPDRAHPNAAGHRAIAEKIWPHLEALLARPGVARAPR
jgi:acyl-CoA thioesterase-1